METGVNMSPDHHTNSPQSLPSRLLKQRPFVAVVSGGAVLAVVLFVYALWFAGGQENDRLAVAPVQRGPLVISVTESGTIQNRERVVIKSEVEGNTTIIYLVPEGVQVEEGDLLVELDSSGLLEQEDQQQIKVISAEAAYISARENLAVIKSQSESDVSEAALAHEFAKQDLVKYEKGDYPRSLQEAQGKITIAQEELQRAKDTLEGSKRLAEKEYITGTELQADQLAANRAQIDLDLAETDLQLLKEYTYKRNLDQLTSDVEQTEMALERVRRRAAADVVQAEAKLKAKQSEYERQQVRLIKMEDQIAKCHIIAPRAGMVIYATTGESYRHRSSEPLQEGQQIHERQNLIYLPSSSSMKVDVKIREASLRKMHLGMPVRVTVEALPARQFWGRVGKIGLLPDARMAWLNPDLKVYSMEIYLEDGTSMLRAGMSCQAEIIVEQHKQALYIPVQAVVRVDGKPTAFVLRDGAPEPREVEIGLDNNQMVRIISGLGEGEEVLLSPPLASATAPPQVGPDLASEERMAASQPASDDQSSPEKADGGIDLQSLFGGKDPRDMTREERRQAFEKLTPEQREQLRKLREAGGGGRSRPHGGEERQ